MFKNHFLIVFAVVFAMSIIFSKVKREKVFQDYKIAKKIIKVIYQDGLCNLYLKAPEEENGG